MSPPPLLRGPRPDPVWVPCARIFADRSHHPGGVKPSYRSDGTWEIPGGGMDPGESPWETACREITEELGLKVKPGRLLAVDWVPAQPDGRPALAFPVKSAC